MWNPLPGQSCSQSQFTTGGRLRPVQRETCLPVGLTVRVGLGMSPLGPMGTWRSVLKLSRQHPENCQGLDRRQRELSAT